MASSKYQSSSFRPFHESQNGSGKNPEVTEFRVPNLSKADRPTYSEIKQTFSPDIKKKDQRFFLSELVSGQFSVEEEEQRRFELRVSEELNARVAAIQEEAHKEGFEKGLESGVAKAFEEERARIAARLESLALATNDLHDSKEKLQADYEQKLTNYAFRIAEIIVESEIKNRPESVSNVIRNILDLLSKEEDVKIYLGIKNKDNLAYVKEEIGKVNRKGSYLIEVKESLNPGDCVVESISGEVSAKLEERIAQFKTEIMNQFDQVEEKKAI